LANLLAGEMLRILLISESEEVHQAVGAALAAGRVSNHRLYWVSQPELAAGRAGDLVPHAILVDDQLGGADPVRLIRHLAAQLPSAALLALVPDGEMRLLREEMLAGARGFVTKPIEAGELAETLRQVLGRRDGGAQERTTAASTGRVLAWCAPKGGTGRTMLAVNSAIGLHQLTGRSTVVVDADFAAPALDVVLNLHGEMDLLDLLPRLAQLDRDLLESVLASHAAGLRVLLAPPPGDLAAPISVPQVQQLVAQLKRNFAWTVVDTGLPLDESMFAFLESADRIVLNVLPEMVGLRNTRLMLDQIVERGHPKEKVWVVLNRASMRGGVSRQAIEERLGVQIHHTIPDDQPLVTHSVNRGIPLILSHPRSAVARAIQGLVSQLAREAPAGAHLNGHNAESTSFLRRLFGGARAESKGDAEWLKSG
jgi:pilus assembly protein CpaE